MTKVRLYLTRSQLRHEYLAANTLYQIINWWLVNVPMEDEKTAAEMRRNGRDMDKIRHAIAAKLKTLS